MTFIDTIPVHDASGDTLAMYEQAQASRGYVPNYALLFSHRPHVMGAWGALLSSITQSMDKRRYELVTIAAARALQSSYCMLAHGSVLLDGFYSTDQLEAIVTGSESADLTAAELAMMDYAAHIARDASSITAAEIETLRAHGFTDPEIFDIAAAAAARCFFSKLLDSLGAEADSVYGLLEDGLRQSLVVGRPIREEPSAVVQKESPAS